MCDPNSDLVEDKRCNCVWRQKRGIEIRVVVVVVVVALERVSKWLRLFYIERVVFWGFFFKG